MEFFILFFFSPYSEWTGKIFYIYRNRYYKKCIYDYPRKDARVDHSEFACEKENKKYKSV